MDKGIKLQAYKQRHGHDINGVRPVMIPDESGEWVSCHDAEHLAEQLERAQSRITELEGRTLSFELPDPSSKAFWGGTGKNETFYPSTYKLWLKEAIERAGIIAGVKIEVI